MRERLRAWLTVLAVGLLVVWALRAWLWRGDVLAIVAGVGLILRVLYVLDDIQTRVKRIEEQL